MSVVYHTPTAADGTQIDSVDVTGPDASLDAAIVAANAAVTAETAARGTAVSAEATTRGAADTAMTTRVNAVHNSDGTLKVGIITGAKILDATITGGLLATNVTAPQSIVWDTYNRVVPVPMNVRGRSRWTTPLSISRDTADAANPFGNPTLVMSAALTLGGKIIYVDECGLNVGDIVRFAALINSAGDSYTLNCRAFTSAGAGVGSVTSSSSSGTMAGTAVLLTTANVTVPATAAYISVWFARTGTTSPLSIYALWGNKGEYLSAYPPPGNGIPDFFTSTDNLMWDPFGREYTPGQDFGGQSRWSQPTGYTITFPDATNPFGGPTLTSTATASQPGKKIYLQDAGLAIGDQVAFSALVASAGGASFSLRCGFWTSAGALISSVVTNAGVLTATPTYVTTVLTAIPATTAYILVTTERGVTATTTFIYALWGGRGGPTPTPAPSFLTGNLVAPEAARNLYEVARTELKQWRYKVAALQTAVASTRAVINLIGDSHFQRTIIRSPLVDYLNTLYGDAGVGYIGIVLGPTSYGYNWTAVRTGTWTDVDIDTDATASGPDGTHTVSSDITATWVVVATVTDFILHYAKVVGGGSFRYKIDSGGYTTVSTNAAAAYTTLSISAGALGSHTLTLEVTVAGSTGVKLYGVEALKNQNGVRVNKLGNGSSKASTWAGMDATAWQTGIAALSADVNMILLGTNDRAANVAPSTFAGQLLTLIDRLRVAMPLADTVLVMPCDTSQTTTFESSAYCAAMRHVAVLRPRVGFVSLYDVMSPYSDGNTRGLYDDALHPGPLGGQVCANVLADVLRVR